MGDARSVDGGRESRLAGAVRAVRELLYGMALHDIDRANVRERAGRERLCLLVTMGDVVGVPILPPSYSPRRLPFVVPEINAWKRRLMRERDLTDAIFG